MNNGALFIPHPSSLIPSQQSRGRVAKAPPRHGGDRWFDSTRDYGDGWATRPVTGLAWNAREPPGLVGSTPTPSVGQSRVPVRSQDWGSRTGDSGLVDGVCGVK